MGRVDDDVQAPRGAPGRLWDKHSASYNRQMAFFDRRFFGDSRSWICGQASGHILEVAVCLVQRLLEVVTVPTGGEHFLRRPIRLLPEHGLTVERHDRFKVGIVERLAARKPA
ncbi:hypothetical protein ACTWPT_39730 [Nonomuraea sp. 3N208]|uniref:hypothetical protein n=1 Tax=Nonomuraea sp. 3N208 TaxID=3457421 RepID=UPI003FCF0374